MPSIAAHQPSLHFDSDVLQLFGSKFANVPVIVALFAAYVLHLYIGFDSGFACEDFVNNTRIIIWADAFEGGVRMAASDNRNACVEGAFPNS
jgi:hypothetical protein